MLRALNAMTQEHEQIVCPACGLAKCTERLEHEEFKYGVGDKAVTLSAKVPVITCEACRESWTDHRGEDARSEAVTLYLQQRVSALEEAERKLRAENVDLLAAMASRGTA